MKFVVTMLALGLAVLAPAARAGEAGEALSKCLIDSATLEDRRALVRWIFSAIAAHPDLDGLTAIDAGRRDQLEHGAAAVFERLVAQDCTAQSREAIVQEGTEGFSAAFKTLGELAMGGVVTDSQVQAGIGRLTEYIDEQRILKAMLSK
jgi:hypothetical protein